MIVNRSITLAITIVSLPMATATAQVRKLIQDTPCSTCRIEAQLIGVVRAADGPGAFPSAVQSVARDSRGRYYVAFQRYPEPPMVFDSAGRFLTVIGRTGAGPNEYQRPVVVLVGAADTLYLLDASNARLTVLDPEYRLVRTAPIPPQTDAAVFTADGLLVIRATINDVARAGYPLHAFDRVGNTRGSFGADVPVLRPRDPYFLARTVATARGGGVWTAPVVNSYVLERWLPDGKLTETIVRSTAWFVPWSSDGTLSPDRPLPTYTRAVWEDRNGFLWVAHLVAAPGFRDALVPARSGAPRWDLVDEGTGYDGRVEVVDPRAGVVLASRAFDNAIYFALGDGLFAGRK